MRKMVWILLVFLVVLVSLAVMTISDDSPPIEPSISRTASTTTSCVTSNGIETCSKVLYSGTMNYDNGSGFVPIDTTINPSEYENYDYEMVKAPYRAYFRNNTNTAPIITTGIVFHYCKDGQPNYKFKDVQNVDCSVTVVKEACALGKTCDMITGC